MVSVAWLKDSHMQVGIADTLSGISVLNNYMFDCDSRHLGMSTSHMTSTPRVGAY